MEDDLKKNKKMEDDLIFFGKTRMTTSKKWKTTSKKMEDDLQKMKKWKTTSNKMEDEPINKNQPNWM